MNKPFVLIAGVLAVVGLVINVGFDLDNNYDMTTSFLWLLVVILIYIGLYTGGKKASATP